MAAAPAPPDGANSAKRESSRRGVRLLTRRASGAPACGFVDQTGAFCIGLIGAPLCYLGIQVLLPPSPRASVLRRSRQRAPHRTPPAPRPHRACIQAQRAARRNPPPQQTLSAAGRRHLKHRLVFDGLPVRRGSIRGANQLARPHPPPPRLAPLPPPSPRRRQLKHRLGFDDALDAFGVHGVGGIVGGLLTGLFANDFVSGNPAQRGAFYGRPAQIGHQARPAPPPPRRPRAARRAATECALCRSSFLPAVGYACC
jgi:hypothetical protein